MGRKGETRSWPEMALSDEMVEYAKLHSVDAESQFEDFRDYHQEKGNKFADWMAAWRRWCRNQEKWQREKRQIGFTAPRPQPAVVMQALRDNAEIAQEVAGMTLEQRQAAVAKFQAIISGIKG